MVIEINAAMTIGEISDLFSSVFPFLQLAFFSRPHSPGEASLPQHHIPRHKTLAQAGTGWQQGMMEIHSWYPTGRVEQDFGKIFGLHVQVLRREGSAWVQTVLTDRQTLEEQNDAGRNASQELMDGTDTMFNEENPR